MHSRKQIETLFHNLNSVRQSAINEMVDNGYDYITAAIRYDMEQAPLGTNEEMLMSIGVDPSADPIEEIIEGLSLWGIYLTETNHLTAEKLRDYLVNKVFKDTVRIIPPNRDCSEFIDLSPVPGTPDSSDRDAYLPRPFVHNNN